jgi:hypothetical protein
MKEVVGRKEEMKHEGRREREREREREMEVMMMSSRIDKR